MLAKNAKPAVAKMSRTSHKDVPAPGAGNTPNASSFEPGMVVGGKYRIGSLIGVGGVGRVYLAKHIELDTDVAIKVLRPEMLQRPDVVQRFGREARASVRLRSERIARVFDVGVEHGVPYFVMECMVGCDLLDFRLQNNPDIATVAELFIQACEGLAEAHAQAIVHRDVKPENLFVVRDENGWRTLKILDFGISKFSLTGKHSDVDLSAKRTEAMLGTPNYISPEQIRATRDVDLRTDLWSLGVVMFEVLSGGVLPFREEREMTALIAEILEMPHRSLLDVAPNVPEGLVAIVDRCLEKDRDKRYQTAAEIALDLLPFAPVRARASVERAVSAMQAAGLLPVNLDLSSMRSSQPPIERLSVSGMQNRLRSTLPESLDAVEISEANFRPSKRWVAPLALTLVVAGLTYGATTLLREQASEPVKVSSGEPVKVSSGERIGEARLPEPLLPPPSSSPEPVASAHAPQSAPRAPASAAVATARPSVSPRPPVAFAPRDFRPHPAVNSALPAPKPVVSTKAEAASNGAPKLDLRRER
ncbi:MAG TPA: serine/threonine-protein kinase [Polyangiaceae bacterium]|nr:serine/threonine-protein kinase [Polyangiaceae bacterium]